MKICHLFYSLNYGGIETLIVNISRWQVINNHKVDIVLLNAEENLNLIRSVHSGVNLIRINRVKGSKNAFDLLKLNFLLFKNNYDVIHAHSAAITGFIFPLLKSKTVLHVHSTLNLAQIRKARYNRCICISNVVKSGLTKNMVTKNVSIIYNGVDFDNFKQRNTNLLFNKIICVGRLKNSIKNQSYIINEFNQIKDKVNSDLYIIGEGQDFNFLCNIISNLNLNNRVFLLGGKSQDWLKNNLCNHDLFIQASKNEGLGIAPIESAAASLPMILSSIEGHLEVSENGKFSKLFNPFIEGDLANKIIDFYENSSFYFELSLKNRDYLKSKFDFQVFNKRILETYNQIID